MLSTDRPIGLVLLPTRNLCTQVVETVQSLLCEVATDRSVSAQSHQCVRPIRIHVIIGMIMWTVMITDWRDYSILLNMKLRWSRAILNKRRCTGRLLVRLPKVSFHLRLALRQSWVYSQSLYGAFHPYMNSISSLLAVAVFAFSSLCT